MRLVGIGNILINVSNKIVTYDNYNSKSAQLAYGFHMPYPGQYDVGNQQWICLASTMKPF